MSRRAPGVRAIAPGAVGLALLAAIGCSSSGGGGGAGAGAGGEPRILFARDEGGQHDLYEIAIDGSGLRRVSDRPENEIPVLEVDPGRLLVSGPGELSLRLGEDPGRPRALSAGVGFTGLVAQVDFVSVFATGPELRDLHAADFRRPDAAPVDLFPGTTTDTFLAVTPEGWVIARDAIGLRASLVDPRGARSRALTGPFASFLGLTNDGRVLVDRSGTLHAVAPDGSSDRPVPGVGSTQRWIGVTRDDRIVFESGGAIYAARAGDVAPELVVEADPRNGAARLDGAGGILLPRGPALLRLEDVRPGETETLVEASDPDEEIEIVALDQSWVFYRVAGTLRSRHVEGGVDGLIAADAATVSDLVFLGGGRVVVLDDRGRALGLRNGGGNSFPLYTPDPGTSIREVRVLGGGWIGLEIERDGQGDLLLAPDPFTAPIPLATTDRNETRPVLVR